MGTHDHLESLYAKQRLLADETARLEGVRDLLDADSSDADQYYLLEIQIAALREEFSRVAARISDVLERDLQR